jgi:hypothetical protein
VLYGTTVHTKIKDVSYSEMGKDNGSYVMQQSMGHSY